LAPQVLPEQTHDRPAVIPAGQQPELGLKAAGKPAVVSQSQPALNAKPAGPGGLSVKGLDPAYPPADAALKATKAGLLSAGGKRDPDAVSPAQALWRRAAGDKSQAVPLPKGVTARLGQVIAPAAAGTEQAADKAAAPESYGQNAANAGMVPSEQALAQPPQSAAATSASTVSAAAGQGAVPKSVQAQLLQQVLQHDLQTGTGSVRTEQLSLQLDPPHLGRLDIHLKQEGQQLIVTVRAELPETEAIMREGSKDLIDGLLNRGRHWTDVSLRWEKSEEGQREQRSQDQQSGRKREQQPQQDRRRQPR
jgi:flagellar hook-length control protein FliK